MCVPVTKGRLTMAKLFVLLILTLPMKLPDI